MASVEQGEFWSGRKDGKGTIIPNIYGEQEGEVKASESLHHCAMADEILCRHCHDNTCTVRKAQRMF